MRPLWILFGLLGLAAVGLGAYGSHAAAFGAPHLQAIFDTGLSYHFAHLPALGLAALLGSLAPAARRRTLLAAGLFLAGLLLFSGSLYLKGLGLAEVTNPLAPTGGVLLMAGWLALAWAGCGIVKPQP